MEPVTLLVLVAYASLVLELVVFPVPSEASCYQLLFESEDDRARSEADALRRARRRSVAEKLVRYLGPTALGVALFLVPLVALPFPGVLEWLVPLEGLRSPGATWSGAALVVLGRTLTFTSVLQLRRQRRAAGFSRGGLFERSRNPGLVGMYVFYLGLALLFPCAVLFAGFVPYVLNMHTRVKMEESHLSERLGDEYRRYLERVPRYVPGFRGSSHPARGAQG